MNKEAEKHYCLKEFKDNKSVSYLVDYYDFQNIENPCKWRVYETTTWDGKNWNCFVLPNNIKLIRLPAWYVIHLQGSYGVKNNLK